jgi:hypothetical protein
VKTTAGVRAPGPVSHALPDDARERCLGTGRMRCQRLADLSKEVKPVATVTREAAYEEDDQGVGWLIVAATLLGLAGILNVIDGIVALSRSKFYTANATYVFSDLRTWGWIVLAVGALLIIAAMGTLSGSQFARWFGISAAGLNAIAQFMFIQAYPFWALVVFACDVIVIYALARFGGRRAAD